MVSTHFTEENYKWTSDRRKMLCVGIDAEPDGVRGPTCSNGTWETTFRSRDRVGGGRVVCLVLLGFVSLVFYLLILVYFPLSHRKSVFWMQDFSEKNLCCPFPHWPVSLAIPHFSELSIDIRLQFSTAAFLSINLFSLGEKHISLV